MHLRTLVPVFLVLVSCSSPTSPLEIAHPDEDGRILGTIEHSRNPIRVDMPTDVAAGEEFSVIVSTYRGGCIAKGEVEVEVASQRATIIPYDYERRGTCTLSGVTDYREVVLQFDRAGIARVVIRGQRKPSREIISIVRTIWVR